MYINGVFALFDITPIKHIKTLLAQQNQTILDFFIVLFFVLYEV